LRTIPDARVNFQSQSDGGGRDLTLYVVGSNPRLVEDTAREAIEQMRTLKELRDPRINGDNGAPRADRASASG
jgi:multidrug efflux pump subunit AcrB